MRRCSFLAAVSTAALSTAALAQSVPATNSAVATISAPSLAVTTNSVAYTQPASSNGPGSNAPPISGAVPRQADAAPTDTDQIVVTGSRLKRALTDTVEPTFIIDSKQIETRGYTNVADALRELPEFGPGINGIGSGQSGFGPARASRTFLILGRSALWFSSMVFVLCRTIAHPGSARPGPEAVRSI